MLATTAPPAEQQVITDESHDTTAPTFLDEFDRNHLVTDFYMKKLLYKGFRALSQYY